MSPITITSSVFRWARDRAGLSDEKIAKRISIKPERLQAWEQGDEQPSYRQIAKLASVLSVPVGYLFLSEPPKIEIPIADFRTLPGKETLNVSPDLQDVLDGALRKRDWYKEWRIREGHEKLDFIGFFSPQSDPNNIIGSMRDVLDIPPDFAANLRSWEDHLRQLVEKVESSGILVLQSGIVGNNTKRKLSVQEFRGFTLVDEHAPIIFINAQDAISARIFTLIHELAHLWTGTSGISNPEIRPNDENIPGIELICNHIAAEFLVPADLFFREWDNYHTVLETTELLARHFRVSGQVILRRAFELQLISNNELFQTWTEIQKIAQKTQAKRGGDFYRNLYVRNSRRFTSELLLAVNSGYISFQDGARLLNTKPQSITNVLAKLG